MKKKIEQIHEKSGYTNEIRIIISINELTPIGYIILY